MALYPIHVLSLLGLQAAERHYLFKNVFLFILLSFLLWPTKSISDGKPVVAVEEAGSIDDFCQGIWMVLVFWIAEYDFDIAYSNGHWWSLRPCLPRFSYSRKRSSVRYSTAAIYGKRKYTETRKFTISTRSVTLLLALIRSQSS